MLDLEPTPIDPTQVTGKTGPPLERAVPFRFKVTWTAIFDPFQTVAGTAVGPLAPVQTRVLAPTPTKPLPVPAEPPPQKPVEKLVPVDTRKLGSAQWEMVVPKMVRAATRPLVREPAPRKTQGATAVAPANDGPAINLYTASTGFLSSLRPRTLAAKLLIASAVVVGVAIATWIHFSSNPPVVTKIETTTRADGWSRQPVTNSEAGFNRSRKLVVFRPTLKASDCSFEFDWKPDRLGTGWVFRAQDTSNYYAMRIKLLKEASKPTFSLEHFAVYHGVEGGRSEKTLVLSRNDAVVRVRTDLSGPTFTVYLNGAAVEYWTDTHLASGGLGFLEEWDHSVDVQSVRMSFAPGTEIQREGLQVYMNAIMNIANRAGV